jgi:hypothetical protein
MYFLISTLFMFVYESKLKGCVKAYPIINGIIHHNFLLANSKSDFLSPLSVKAHQGRVPIKTPKMEDIKTLRPYIPEEHLGFFEEIGDWPKHDTEEPSDFEIEETLTYK